MSVFGETGCTISVDINENTLDGHEEFVKRVIDEDRVAKRVKTIVHDNVPIKVDEDDEKTRLLVHEVESDETSTEEDNDDIQDDDSEDDTLADDSEDETLADDSTTEEEDDDEED